ncbi:MAG TPA: orotidine-5'-phosphate decarboxylase [Gemmatimonadaceae bacterium]|nr:orotidine-5'-phosphate decarboxylase [Gemmatimonadaceae bacterium]
MTTPIVALDVSRVADALALVDRLDGLCGFYKVGLQLFTAEGPAIVRAVRERGRGAEVFLDLKLHDIPNTVRGAVASAAAHGARLVTVHASGGRAMLDEAQAAAAAGGCSLLAVTVLTSLDAAALAAAWGRDGGSGRTLDVGDEVLRLSAVAAAAGLHGVVCSGREAGAVRSRFGGRLATLVPGVRLAGMPANDQARVVTPGEAVLAGAAYVVLGRTVTAAGDPRIAMERVLAELAAEGSSGG